MEKVQVFGLAMILVIAIGVEVSDAQSSICNVPISGLMACQGAVTLPNPSAPTRACCSAITRADIPCLCKYKNSSLLPTFGIDPNLALQLPAKCNLPAPNC
ncbi:putative lipid-transfer protein DIR1 [Mercurialis annua]|uniref:putative lipid-transfer protein DIR1 n=1 Tax=Mercurialis annua TaxID=3986 RepID=UPI00215F7FD5|nr:putative lipid-transfer protein DIR1 [Mercurialis annua]